VVGIDLSDEDLKKLYKINLSIYIEHYFKAIENEPKPKKDSY